MKESKFGWWNKLRNNNTGEEIEANSILFYPNGLDNYIEALQKLMDIPIEEKLKLPPIVVSMYLANTCRDDCVGCFAKKKYVLDGSMRKEIRRTKRDIIDELISYGIMDFKFGGGGDPLMAPEFIDVLRLLYERNTRSVVITNGDNIRPNFQALAYYVTHFRFSANANNRELHERMNRPYPEADDFDTRIENVRELVALRKEAGLVSGTTYLVNKAVEGSVEGLEEYLNMAIDIGFDYLAPRLVGGVEPYREALQRLKEKSRESNGINIILSPEISYPVKEDVLLFLKTTIDNEHRVYSCPGGIYRYRQEFGNYGDMDKESFSKIWAGEKRASLVLQHLSNICEKCFYVRNGRSGVYNWLMDQMKKDFDFQLVSKNEG